MTSPRISFSLRAFIVYFIILGALSWFILDNAIERLNDGMRQSAESVMVDMSHLLAAAIEDEISKQNSANSTDPTVINTEFINRIFDDLRKRSIQAKIYQITKNTIESDVYVTDHNGIVIYDSIGESVGKDYSQWRDVRLTLDGEYGARTSFKDPEKTEDHHEKIMVIAAPIFVNKPFPDRRIIGSISVSKSINSLEGHLATESNQLKRYALLILLLAAVIGYLISLWFTHSLEKISNYARTMAQGKKVDQPSFWDERLDNLSNSITHLRNQLDGKEYVENYIHSLTHELKTPITSIRGAAELLHENMPAEQQKKFLSNISSSNRRMALLVDKMLSLAKLEGLTELVAIDEFDLVPSIRRLIQEREPVIQQTQLRVNLPQQSSYPVFGDRLLIIQAIANLLDNAIDFCDEKGTIDISLNEHNIIENTNHTDTYSISVFNQGEAIPDFALSKMYDRFFSLPRPNRTMSGNPQSKGKKSTGLGLSFVHEIMQLHQGTVSIHNLQHGVSAKLFWPRPLQ